MNHPIFHTPYDVHLTLADLPTPAAYAREHLGPTMTMWRVQTEGYSDGTGQLIGMVSRDAGFLDSPDAEWISSGVNSKNSRAVAIGRHGNFFLWGFAVSPTYLTDEARLVFVNAVHYIAGFDGQGLIARKRPGTAMRSYLRDALEGSSAEGYAQVLKRYEGYAAEDAKRKQAIRQRIAAGDKVSERERQMLNFPAPTPPGRFDGIRRFLPADVWPTLAGDEKKIRAYVEKVLPYMRSQGWYHLVVDDELMQFGVANNDPQLLPRLIGALDGPDDKLARTLLARYTDRSFTTKAQWAKWYARNKADLFFTEAGGYRWLVNVHPEAAGARQRAARVEERSARTTHPAPRAEQGDVEGSPIHAKAQIEALADGKHELRVVITIDDGWHAYQAVPAGSPYRTMDIELELPEGLQRTGDWRKPTGKPDTENPSLIIYEGEIAFRCELTGKLPKDLRSIAATLSYQVCDAEMCQPPTSVVVTPER